MVAIVLGTDRPKTVRRRESDYLEKKTNQILLLLARSFLNQLFQSEGDILRSISVAHRRRIQQALQAQVRIQFALPAFPAKSPNREKTVGDLPDLGEWVSLSRLNQLCDAIGRIHAPGAEVIICSDGRVFSDLVLVPDSTISHYALAIRQMIRLNNWKHLHCFHLEDALQSHAHDQIRAELLERWALPLDAVRERVENDEKTRCLFNGMHRFLFEDRLVLAPLGSKAKTRDHAKADTYELIRRSDAWSRLIAERFPAAVRLSIHPQFALSEKLGIQLLPSLDFWRTPWHSVVLLEGGCLRLIPHREAKRDQAKLFLFNQRYAYFAKHESSDRDVIEACHAFQL